MSLENVSRKANIMGMAEGLMALSPTPNFSGPYFFFIPSSPSIELHTWYSPGNVQENDIKMSLISNKNVSNIDGLSVS